MAKATQASDPWIENHHFLEDELVQAQQALREVCSTLEQSQAELGKLTQRNATINGQLQQLRAQLDNLQRADIRTAYDTALEIQQRMLVMRGQLEKYQAEQAGLQRYISLLEKILLFMKENSNGPTGLEVGGEILAKVINAQESERQRLSRMMHDGPAQALSNFIVQTEIASRLFEIDPNRAKDELVSLKNSAMSTFQKVRTFIFELRPMMLDDLGLFPTIKRYVEAFKEQNKLNVTLSIKGQEKRFEPYLEVMIFRGLQELMGNAVRHNQDNPMKVDLTVQVTYESNLIKVSVSDNGKGFGPDAAGAYGGIGLKLIKERVELVGGGIEIDAAIGQGSKITFQVPCVEISG